MSEYKAKAGDWGPELKGVPSSCTHGALIPWIGSDHGACEWGWGHPGAPWGLLGVDMILSPIMACTSRTRVYIKH